MPTTKFEEDQFKWGTICQDEPGSVIYANSYGLPHRSQNLLDSKKELIFIGTFDALLWLNQRSFTLNFVLLG